jgi:hypothetical protein
VGGVRVGRHRPFRGLCRRVPGTGGDDSGLQRGRLDAALEPGRPAAVLPERRQDHGRASSAGADVSPGSTRAALRRRLRMATTWRRTASGSS